MDISCIISSGELELYVLGLLPEEEAYKIEQLASLFPEIDDEINRIHDSLHLLNQEIEVKPGPHVRDNFINAIKELKAKEESTDNPSAQATVHQLHKEEKALSVNKNVFTGRFLAAASLILLVLSAAFIIYLLNSRNHYHEKLSAFENKAKLDQQKLRDYEEMIAVIHNPLFKKVELKNVPGKPQAVAEVFMNNKTAEVYLCNITLPIPPAGKQYQLWAIVNGRPVNAGVVRHFWQPIQKMNAFRKADSFSITLEKEGGSQTPTITDTYVTSDVS